MEDPVLFTEEEVAAKLRVSAKTIRREREKGKLGYLKIGHRVFITPEQINAYLEIVSVDPVAPKAKPPPQPVPRGGSSPPPQPQFTRPQIEDIAQASFERAQQIFKRGGKRK